jgi:hypothetical protein
MTGEWMLESALARHAEEDLTEGTRTGVGSAMDRRGR